MKSLMFVLMLALVAMLTGCEQPQPVVYQQTAQPAATSTDGTLPPQPAYVTQQPVVVQQPSGGVGSDGFLTGMLMGHLLTSSGGGGGYAGGSSSHTTVVNKTINKTVVNKTPAPIYRPTATTRTSYTPSRSYSAPSRSYSSPSRSSYSGRR